MDGESWLPFRVGVAKKLRGERPCERIATAFVLLASGVGNNPYSLSPVPSSDSASRNNKRPPGVAAGIQVRKHIVEAHADVPSNVLSNDPRGPEFVHEPTHFRPEVAVIFLAAALPGETERLAWVAAANNVDWSDMLALQLSHVTMDGNARPMLGKHALTKRIYLAEGHRLHASALEPQAEAADPGEQVQHPHLPSLLPR